MSGKRLVSSLFLSYLWITLAAVIAMGVYGAHTARKLYLDRAAEDLEAQARLSECIVLEFLGQDDQRVDAVCKQLGEATNARFTVILPDGQVVGDTKADPTSMDNHKDRPEIRRALTGKVGQFTRHSPTLEEDLMYVAIPVYRRDSIVAVARTSLPVTKMNDAVGAMRIRTVVAVLVVTCLLAGVSLWQTARIGRPLRQIERRIGAVRARTIRLPSAWGRLRGDGHSV